MLGEVEVVFGFWAIVLVVAMALTSGRDSTFAYAESRNYTEPLFVFVLLVLVVAAPQIFSPDVPERVKHLAIGVLFVNVSTGGTLTSYAAPPVLTVASTWQWVRAYMFATFTWRCWPASSCWPITRRPSWARS